MMAASRHFGFRQKLNVNAAGAWRAFSFEIHFVYFYAGAALYIYRLLMMTLARPPIYIVSIIAPPIYYAFLDIYRRMFAGKYFVARRHSMRMRNYIGVYRRFTTSRFTLFFEVYRSILSPRFSLAHAYYVRHFSASHRYFITIIRFHCYYATTEC